MFLKKSSISILSFMLLASIGSVASAVSEGDTIGAVHGAECHAKNPNDNITNAVWGIENQDTSKVGSVTCAVLLTDNLVPRGGRAGDIARIKVAVVNQDFRGSNKCRARLRNDNGTGNQDFGWVTNTKTGTYPGFDIVDEYLDFSGVKGKYMVVECELHKKQSGENPATIRAIKITAEY